jgi:hypothetical protein
MYEFHETWCYKLEDNIGAANKLLQNKMKHLGVEVANNAAYVITSLC